MNWFKKVFSKNKSKPISRTNPLKEYMSSIKKAGSDNGVHYTDKIELIKQLKRDKKYDEAIEVLLKCVELTENESKKANSKPVSVLEDSFSLLSALSTSTWGVAPWYYEQLSIVYRKQKKYAEEVAILVRYEGQPKAPGVGPVKLADRLIKAREFLANNNP
jgi:hypothetical protein